MSLPVARRLKGLRLTGALRNFAWLWEYSAHNTPFPNLTELYLVVYQSFKSKKQPEPSLCLEHFFRSLIPTLQNLYIRTRLDISALFNALSQPLSHFDPIFPELKSLRLRIHFNVSCQFSPQSFRRFLLTHNNLHLLCLDLMTSHINRDPGDPKPLRLDAWLAELVNDNYQLPFLQSLDTYPSNDTQSGFFPILTFIRRTAPTLTNLKISHRSLTDEEALLVIDALTQGKSQVQAVTTTKPKELKGLMLSLTHLTVPFIDLLATKFPQLEDLTLRSEEVVGTDQDSFYGLLRRRWYNPKVTDAQDILHTWKLRDISIEVFDDSKESSRATTAVVGTVPALVRKMDEDHYYIFDRRDIWA